VTGIWLRPWLRVIAGRESLISSAGAVLLVQTARVVGLDRLLSKGLLLWRLGRQLRALRTAAGRTVASVAADAGLSVPYVANLENGRGNPTTTALSRLAAALDTQLTITFDGAGRTPSDTPPLPHSLVRLSRTHRFRHDVQLVAEALGHQPQEVSAQLTRALAQLAQTMGRDLHETDWWRLLDAVLLVAAHPA
jgi:transcriptional regulator with XRE-family HTH domain